MVTITAWITDLFACMGGCFGCCVKPTPIIAVDEPAKGLRIQGQTVRKPTISDGFWSSSTCDLDNSTIQSQRSLSSVSTLNQILYNSNGTSTAGTNPEFVNQGLLLWNESRLQWVGSGKSGKQSQQKQEPRLNFSPVDGLSIIVFVIVGMQLVKVCLGLGNLSPSQYLYLKWLNSWWMFGSVKECMVETSEVKMLKLSLSLLMF